MPNINININERIQALCGALVCNANTISVHMIERNQLPIVHEYTRTSTHWNMTETVLSSNGSNSTTRTVYRHEISVEQVYSFLFDTFNEELDEEFSIELQADGERIGYKFI